MNAPAPAAEAAANRMSARSRGLLILAAVVVLAGAAIGAWWWLLGRWYESTDDAYVGGTVVQVTAEIPGTIRTVHPRETDSVAAGQPLIEFDAADARIALDAALADLAATVRQVSGAFAQVERARAQVTAREKTCAWRWRRPPAPPSRITRRCNGPPCGCAMRHSRWSGRPSSRR